MYRKPTNRDDFIHYFSAHSKKTKEAVVVGFFLRALRISSPEYLEQEIAYIIAAFRRLAYPEGLLLRLRRRATLIRTRPRREEEEADKPQRIIIPYSPLTDQLQELLGPSISVASTAGTKLGDLVSLRRPQHRRPNSDVYSIPCGGCERSYVGETGRGTNVRIREHRSALRRLDPSSAFVVHRDITGHVPRWIDAKIIANGLPLVSRKILEAALITTTQNLNTSQGSHELAKAVATRIAQVK